MGALSMHVCATEGANEVRGMRWLGEDADHGVFGAKKVKFLLLFLFAISCCSLPAPTAPRNDEIICHSDEECPDGWYCGFAGVDTYATCRR